MDQSAARCRPRYWLHGETKIWVDRSSVSTLRLQRGADVTRRARCRLRRVTLDRARHRRRRSNRRSRTPGRAARGRPAKLRLPRLRQGFQAGDQARLAHSVPRRLELGIARTGHSTVVGAGPTLSAFSTPTTLRTPTARSPSRVTRGNPGGAVNRRRPGANVVSERADPNDTKG